ncbi:MAG: hypothetical protein SH819_01725 [Cytophagales bacterium]|nr:hypothetical protein [Cytophagales bacterium]
MNMMQTLLRDHSVAIRRKIVGYVGEDPSRFAELMDLFLTGSYVVQQRASWPLSYCVQQHPSLIKPHLRKVIRNLGTQGVHDAVRRNTLRLLQFVAIPRTLQGEAAERCFELLTNANEPVAIRVFAMTVLFNIAHEQPALRSELTLVLEDKVPYGSAAFISRAGKTLRQLKKLAVAGNS